jgi:hypothetical protein
VSYPIPVPPGYEPFPELVLCSNTLRDVSIPIAVSRAPLLLVGRGTGVPLVWLAAPAEPGPPNWLFAVKENRSNNPAVRVKVELLRKTVRVSVSGRDVLRVLAVSPLRAEVGYLDLRPLGLDVVGTSDGLRIGSTQLAGNTMDHLEVAFDLNPTAPDSFATG